MKLELKLQEQELRSQPCSPAAVPSPTLAASQRSGEGEEAALYASMSRPTVVATSSSPSMPSSSRFIGPNLASTAESSAHQYAYASVSISSAIATHSAPLDISTFNFETADNQANMAMVSDGSRYGGGNQLDTSQLPPYSPGNQRTMNGHGNENNDTRLSEYVKGETRAQDMKDGRDLQ